MDCSQLMSMLGDFDPDTPSTHAFWDDEHISGHMLAAHLDEGTDAASRREVHRKATLDWLGSVVFSRLDKAPEGRANADAAPPGLDVLDLGCGPGLYALPLARAGHRVTGMDLSARSLDHARKAALKEGLDIEWRQGSYLELGDQAAFDVALMIYCDMGALREGERRRVLDRIRRALRPGGLVVFDFFGPEFPSFFSEGRTWSLHEGGFWGHRAHLLLEDHRHFATRKVCGRRMVALDQAGREAKTWYLRDYYFTVESITELLVQCGYGDVAVHSKVIGETNFGSAPVYFAVARA